MVAVAVAPAGIADHRRAVQLSHRMKPGDGGGACGGAGRASLCSTRCVFGSSDAKKRVRPGRGDSNYGGKALACDALGRSRPVLRAECCGRRYVGSSARKQPHVCTIVKKIGRDAGIEIPFPQHAVGTC
jgi:hypothetical protein